LPSTGSAGSSRSASAYRCRAVRWRGQSWSPTAWSSHRRASVNCFFAAVTFFRHSCTSASNRRSCSGHRT